MTRKPRRTKKANLVLPLILVLLLLTSSLLVGASSLPPKASVLQSSILSIFELEGNIADESFHPGLDWSTLNTIPISNNVAPLIAHTGVIRDPAPSSIFSTSGSRDSNDISEWRHSTGSVQDKGDISNAYVAAFLTASNELFIVVGADRLEAGDGTIGFWLLQKRVVAAADGTFRTGSLSTDPLATHTFGDVLVLVEFSQGGTLGTGRVFQWVGPGGSVGGTLNEIGVFPAGSVFGDQLFFAISNSAPVKAPWLYVPKKSPAGIIPAGAFFEGAVNVGALIGTSFLCNPTVLVETRSSASVSAPLQDFVLLSFRPSVSVTSVPPICQATPITLPISLSEGTPPYSVSATSTGGLNVRGITIGATTPGGAPGDYQITTTATDVNGCIGSAVANLKIVACP